MADDLDFTATLSVLQGLLQRPIAVTISATSGHPPPATALVTGVLGVAPSASSLLGRQSSDAVAFVLGSAAGVSGAFVLDPVDFQRAWPLEGQEGLGIATGTLVLTVTADEPLADPPTGA